MRIRIAGDFHQSRWFILLYLLLLIFASSTALNHVKFADAESSFFAGSYGAAFALPYLVGAALTVAIVQNDSPTSTHSFWRYTPIPGRDVWSQKLCSIVLFVLLPIACAEFVPLLKFASSVPGALLGTLMAIIATFNFMMLVALIGAVTPGVLSACATGIVAFVLSLQVASMHPAYPAEEVVRSIDQSWWYGGLCTVVSILILSRLYTARRLGRAAALVFVLAWSVGIRAVPPVWRVLSSSLRTSVVQSDSALTPRNVQVAGIEDRLQLSLTLPQIDSGSRYGVPDAQISVRNSDGASMVIVDRTSRRPSIASELSGFNRFSSINGFVRVYQFPDESTAPSSLTAVLVTRIASPLDKVYLRPRSSVIARGVIERQRSEKIATLPVAFDRIQEIDDVYYRFRLKTFGELTAELQLDLWSLEVSGKERSPLVSMEFMSGIDTAQISLEQPFRGTSTSARLTLDGRALPVQVSERQSREVPFPSLQNSWISRRYVFVVKSLNKQDVIDVQNAQMTFYSWHYDAHAPFTATVALRDSLPIMRGVDDFSRRDASHATGIGPPR
jgi:hypothetical protein